MPCKNAKNNRLKQWQIRNITEEAPSHLLLPVGTVAKQENSFYEYASLY